MVQLHPHALALARRPGLGDLVRGLVDADDLGSLPGEGDGVVAGPAAEVEDALPLDAAEELAGVLARRRRARR